MKHYFITKIVYKCKLSIVYLCILQYFMQQGPLLELIKSYKENSLNHRYITNRHIGPLLNKLKLNFAIDEIGNSVNNEPIFSVTLGSGPKKILMWSQMHGNESTTTKALFDLFNVFRAKNEFANTILECCTLKIVPILNPDGARLYTRLNANDIDLNRDAQDLSQPESVVLLNLFNDFKPDFCFNLHGQRTIFSVGKMNRPATVSFLAPAQDVETTITKNRQRAMEIIVKMNEALQKLIPSQVGIYDDSFNLNCVGDTFQSKNIPTILFEAGHFAQDYEREQVREYIGFALLNSLNYITENDVSGLHYADYFQIPMNDKLFFDVIIRNAKLKKGEGQKDVAIQFQEVLVGDEIEFKPIIEKIGDLSNYYGHLETNASSALVLAVNGEQLFEGYENDFVLINNELFALKAINS